MAKNPFERILSMVERKKIFTTMVVNKIPMVIKLTDGKMITYVPGRITADGSIDGVISDPVLKEAKQRRVVVFFYSGKDRYFLNTTITKISKHGWRMAMTPDYYKLNRRESYRIEIPESIQISFIVDSLQGTACHVQVRVTEFSAGGARIRWTSALGLARDYKMRGALLWLKGKEFPVEAVVKHKTKDGSFGIEFVNLDPTASNRLKIMSIELQQIVNFSN